MVRKIIRCARGASAVEYALVAALIAMAVFASLGAVGTRLNGSYANTESKL